MKRAVLASELRSHRYLGGIPIKDYGDRAYVAAGDDHEDDPADRGSIRQRWDRQLVICETPCKTGCKSQY
jgi:hypothetical protein